MTEETSPTPEETRAHRISRRSFLQAGAAGFAIASLSGSPTRTGTLPKDAMLAACAEDLFKLRQKFDPFQHPIQTTRLLLGMDENTIKLVITPAPDKKEGAAHYHISYNVSVKDRLGGIKKTGDLDGMGMLLEYCAEQESLRHKHPEQHLERPNYKDLAEKIIDAYVRAYPDGPLPSPHEYKAKLPPLIESFTRKILEQDAGQPPLDDNGDYASRDSVSFKDLKGNTHTIIINVVVQDPHLLEKNSRGNLASGQDSKGR